MEQDKTLVYLPSPIGDAILCTPALRALRRRFQQQHICFLASETVRQFLSPSQFNDDWIINDGKNFITLAMEAKKRKFARAILFKNSFSCALVTFLAGIPERIGYDRDGRALLLTGKIDTKKNRDGRFEPVSMIDYYMEIAASLGCETDNKQTELTLDNDDVSSAAGKLPDVFSQQQGGRGRQGGPLVILVPGGAFGASKWWPAERFAETADRLIEKYNAVVVVSVAPNKIEKQIARNICGMARNKLYSLADNPLTIGELKGLFAAADVVITNDTGGRHIATAFKRKTISLFGPNNPQWTQTGYEGEIQITGSAECVPCDKPKCRQARHLCMESISIEMVCEAAKKFLGKGDE